VRVVLLGARGPVRVEFEVAPDGVLRPGRRDGAEAGRGALLEVLELELPLSSLGYLPGDHLALAVEVGKGALELERLPRSGYLPLAVPSPDFEGIHWRV